MGVFDKLKKAVSIKDDDYDDDEFYDDEDLDEEDDLDDEEEPRKKGGFFSNLFKRRNRDNDIDDEDFDEEDEEEEPASSVPAARPAAAPRPAAPVKRRGRNVEINVNRPSNMEDCRDIADTLLAGSMVVLNLEGMDVEVAQRVVDFSSGACYSIGGTLQKVSSYIFILTPANVDVSGDVAQVINGTAVPSIRTNL